MERDSTSGLRRGRALRRLAQDGWRRNGGKQEIRLWGWFWRCWKEYLLPGLLGFYHLVQGLNVAVHLGDDRFPILRVVRPVALLHKVELLVYFVVAGPQRHRVSSFFGLDGGNLFLESR